MSEPQIVEPLVVPAKSSKGWRWRVVSLDLAAASETVDETPVTEPAAASAASAKPAGDPQAKRPRLTVGKSSVPDGAKSAADPQAKRPRLKVGSTSSTPGSAPQGVAQLGEEAAIRAAQRWYQREHSAELKPLKIFRNSEREYSILYCTEPNLSGNTYLRRYKYAPPPSDGTGEWTVRSRPFEDDAALHEDGKDPKPAELDRETAVKAASRWYNKYFSGGGNRMDSPVIAAYGNTERDLEVTEGREWSLRYTANSEPQEHFIRFKYMAAESKKKGWVWVAIGYSEEEQPSELVGNAVEGYGDDNNDEWEEPTKAASKRQAKRSSGGSRKRSKAAPASGSGASSKGKKMKQVEPAAPSKQQAAPDRPPDPAPSLAARIRAPKRELVPLPFVLPPEDEESQSTVVERVSAVGQSPGDAGDERLTALWREHAERARRHRTLEAALLESSARRSTPEETQDDSLDDEALARRMADVGGPMPTW